MTEIVVLPTAKRPDLSIAALIIFDHHVRMAMMRGSGRCVCNIAKLLPLRCLSLAGGSTEIRAYSTRQN